MTITTAQIRGARGILNWSQSDLSERTGISATSLGSIESGNSVPRAHTLEKIKNSFESAGIEFLGLDGVRLQSNYIRVLTGKEGFKEYLDDLYDTIIKYGTKDKPVEIYLSNVVHSRWPKFAGEEFWKMHVRRMAEAKDLILSKIITKYGDRDFPANEYAEYRWMKGDMSCDQSFFSYHDKLVLLDFEKKDVSVTIIHHKEFAEGYRNLFKATWNYMTVIPDKKVE